MLQEGDKITLGCSPTIKVGDSFVFLKPHASVTRTLSDDVMEDLTDAQTQLRALLFRSLRTEIEAINNVYDALGDGDDLEALIALCEKEIGDVESQTGFSVEKADEAGDTPAVELDGEGNILSLPVPKLGVVKKGVGKLAKVKPNVKKKPKG